MISRTCVINTEPCCAQKRKIPGTASVSSGRVGHLYLKSFPYPRTIDKLTRAEKHQLHLITQKYSHAFPHSDPSSSYGWKICLVQLILEFIREILLQVITEIIALCYTCISMSSRSLYCQLQLLDLLVP